MLGSSAFRMSVTPGGALAGPWVKNSLWSTARAVPSLDLPFADTKSLTDAVTGQSLVTFTRASSGTYVGSDGVLRTAAVNEPRFGHNPTTGESLGLLVEEQRTNLLLQSNGFDTTWTNTNSSRTAAVGTAPDGTNTAWELKDTLDATSATHSLFQSVSFVSGTSYTLSVFAKAGTLPCLGLVYPGAAFGSTLASRYNLLTGTVASTPAGATSSIESFPNGWYRCSITLTATATASASISLRTGTVSATTYQGDGTGTILIWGAQLEAGAFPTSYIPTTTAAATRSADVASITGSNFGTTRTNLLLRSEEFDNAYWTKTNSTVTANATTAPNGALTAEKLITNSGASSGRVSVSITATADTPATLSCYAKQGETNIFGLFISDGITGRAADFNLTTGTVSGTPTAGMTASIQPVGDGWYRCVVTVAGASLSGTTRSLRIVQTVVAADGTSGLFIWGAQFEQSTTVSEYIPTTSATVTVVDSSWYRQDEGTVYGDFIRTASTNSQQGRVFSFSDGTNTNQLEIYQTGGSNPSAQITVTTLQAQWITSNFAIGAPTREVLGYQLNNTNASFNGSAETTDTVCTMPTALTQARIGDRQDGIRTLNGTIRRLCYWGQRLPDSILQTITR